MSEPKNVLYNSLLQSLLTNDIENKKSILKIAEVILEIKEE